MYQQNNMKKILFILLLLPFISKAQLEQNHPEPGGHLFVGVRSTSWLRPPSDTATNKTGIARIGTALYIGNGTYWSASGLIYTGTTPISVSGTVISMAQASAIASGYLSSTDWSLFNAKQDALVSGTNIKTVNSSSILGSGNLSVGTVTGTGTLNFVPKWTPSGSALGDSKLYSDATGVGIDNTAPLAPLHVGGQNVTNSVDPAILASRSLTGAGNSHAFADATNFAKNVNTAYNSFDARATIGGSVNYDHYAGFQVAPIFNSTGTMTNLYGYYFKPSFTAAGVITNNYGLYVANMDAISGTVTNNYGLYVESLTRGGANYAVYTNGSAASVFGGAVTSTGLLNANAVGGNLRLKADGTTAKDGGIFANAGGDIYFANWDANRGSYVKSTGELNILSALTTINGVTSSFPAFRRNGALFELRLADNSAGTGLIATTATASTSVTSPLLIGGTTTTSPLTYKTTTGVGTTGADHIFQVGNNGATEAMRILNNGNVGIGIAAPLTLLQISRGTASTADADIPQILLENTNTTSTSFAINRIRTGTGYAAGYPELWLQASGGTGGLTTIRGVSNHRMAFKTNDTEAMTISTSQNLGIGTGATVSARLHTISTTEQLRLGYDASNYYSTTVGSTGIATFNAVGSGSSFEFSDRVAVPKLKGNSSTPSISVGTGAASVSLSTNSTDLAGEMVINTDAVTAAGATIATVTFSTAYSTAPFVTFSATNDDASSTNNNWYVVPTTTGFAFKSFSSGNDPLVSTTLKFSYHVIQ